MLEALRNSVNTWFAKVLLGLLVVSFAVWGISDVFLGRTQTTIAKVGEREIEAQDYARALTERLRGIQQQSGRVVTLSEARRLGLDQVVLAQITTREALNEEASSLGLSADADAVRNAIENAPSFRNALGDFDRDTYERLVRYRGQSISEFEEEVREDLAREILLQSVGVGTSAPRAFAETLYQYRNEERVFEYVVLTPDNAPDPGEPIDEQVAAYHADNPEPFTAPEYRSLDVAWLTAEALAETIEIGEAAVSEAYEARKAEFTTPATRTLDQLLFDTEEAARGAKDAIDGGESFAAIVEAEGANPRDVALGRVTRDELPEALASVAFGADEPGILDPVQTAFGWTLLNLRGVEAQRTSPLEEVADRLREELALQEARNSIVEESVAFDDELAGGATLQQAADLTAAQFVALGPVDASGRDPEGVTLDELPPIAEILEAAFETSTGEEPRLVEVDSGGFFAVTVREVEEAALRPLEEVRDEVVAAWQLAQRQQSLGGIAKELRQAIEGGETLDVIAAKREIELRDTGPFRRSARVRGIPDALIESVFGAEEGAVLDGPGEEGSHVVGRLAEIVAVEPVALETALDTETERYAARLANDLVQAYTRSAQDRNPTLLYPGVIDATLAELGQRY